jgi:hypothetical protein
MVSEAQKRANLKWRELNKEKYLAKQREYQSKYYEQNSHKILQNKKEFYINVLKPRKDAKKQLHQPETITYEPKLAGGLAAPETGL